MSPPRSALRDLVLAAFTAASWILPLALGAFVLGAPALRGDVAMRDAFFVVGALAATACFLYVTYSAWRGARESGPAALTVAYELAVLAVLPAWGLVVNHSLEGRCVRDACGPDVQRAFAEPWVVAPALLHVATALAYGLSRRRPARLPHRVEALVLAAMVTGLALQVSLAVQLGMGFLLVGLMVAPIGLPVVMPLLATALYANELSARLRRRGAEEAELPHATVGEGAYRSATLEGDARESSWSRPWLARAAALSPALLGVYGVLAALVTRRPAAGVMAFTETCEHVFSALPLEVVPRDCHYLCTVAARGHTWLVRPERMGVRGGVPIVVNRQLAVANAFEDLLHARWPRFGRLCRRAYDALALPVSRVIRWRAVADAIYLAMKPAEWLFYAALLALDPGDPERRIARMYRPAPPSVTA